MTLEASASIAACFASNGTGSSIGFVWSHTASSGNASIAGGSFVVDPASSVRRAAAGELEDAAPARAGRSARERAARAPRRAPVSGCRARPLDGFGERQEHDARIQPWERFATQLTEPAPVITPIT